MFLLYHLLMICMLTINECGFDSLVSNSFINAKVSEKNLTFGIDKTTNIAKKCRKIHTGRENELCPPFKADFAGVPNESSEKYLGDIISSDGKVEKTIKMLSLIHISAPTRPY